MSLPVGAAPHRNCSTETTADSGGTSCTVSAASREASMRVARASRVSMTSKAMRTVSAAATAFSSSSLWVAVPWGPLTCSAIQASQASVELRRSSG